MDKKISAKNGDSFQSERLVMKRLCLDDKDLIFSLRSNAEVVKFTGIKVYTSINDAIKYIQRISNDIDNKECLMWSIALLSTLEPVGTICFWNFSPDKKVSEIGYDLLPEHWGKGYAAEAIQKALSFGFFDYGFDVVFATPRHEHTNSQKVLEKSGFLIAKKNEKEGVDENQSENAEACFYRITKSEFAEIMRT